VRLYWEIPELQIKDGFWQVETGTKTQIPLALNKKVLFKGPCLLKYRFIPYRMPDFFPSSHSSTLYSCRVMVS
jgi:hypothetical protein